MEYKMRRITRALGVTSSKLLSILSANDKNIFTITDAQKITKTSPTAIRMLLSDLVRKKWLIRLAPGHYLIVPLSAGDKAEFSENWYVVAKHLIKPNPYYLSHYSALDIHEMTTQPLMTIYTTTPKRRKEAKVLGATFRFIYAKPSNLWGTEEIWVKPAEKARVSDLERTFVDCLSSPKLCGGISEVAKGIWTKRRDINYPRLIEYVKRFNSRAVAKRLGFLLELYEIADEEILKQLKIFVSPSFVLLDPSLPAQGKYLNLWKLRVNLDPDELKEIVKT